MSDVNLIQWLASGPYLFFALVVGLIVSFDVCVVELTRDYEPSTAADGAARAWTSPMKWMLFWHALFHAGSFWLYSVTIYALQFLAFLPIDLFDLPEGVGIGTLTLINFIIVCFIWWTYRGKIAEDHSAKDGDAAVLNRKDMQLLVNLARGLAKQLGFGDRTKGIAIAGSVAVDMLAMSALLKSYLLPNLDAPARSQLFGIVLVDVTAFAVVIFFTVGFMVLLAQALGHFLRNSFKLIVALRLAEPFVVFYLLAGTVRTVMEFGLIGSTSSNQYNSFLVDATFACLVVMSLIISNGMGWQELTAIYAKRSRDTSGTDSISITAAALNANTPTLTLASIAIVFISAIVAMSIAYSTAPGPGTHNHLIEATGYFAEIVLACIVLYVYLPSARLDLSETRENIALEGASETSPFEHWTLLAGVALGLLALNGFNLIVLGRSAEIDAILLWSIYLSLTWSLYNLRRLRFRRADSVLKSNKRVKDANFAELVSTIEIASAIVALSALKIVSKLLE